MRIRALAADGDGTLLRGDRMAKATQDALKRFHDSGRKLILVTGETLRELNEFPHLELFDCVVAENGGLLYWPDRRRHHLLARKPPRPLMNALRRGRFQKLKLGEVVIAMKISEEKRLAPLLRQFAPSWHIIRNRKDVMLLPKGVDKASGLQHALGKLRLRGGQVAAIGDAENDRALLAACGVGAAVKSAVPGLKKCARTVMHHGAGRGVVELIERLMNRDDKSVRRNGVQASPKA